MSIKLDDLLNEVKPPPQALDLANTEMKTKEQFLNAYSKVPEYRMKSEKVRPEDVTGDGPGGWRGRVGDPHVGEYADPLPPSMRGLALDEFYQVNIDWRMLTTARPANKFEEEVFSRYVDLGRAQLERLRQETDENLEQDRIVKVVPGRGSLPEVRIATCRHCGEELCDGVCEDYMYDHYARTQPDKKEQQGEEEGDSEADEEAEEKQKKKKKRRKKKKKTKKVEVDFESGDEADNE